MGEAIKVKDWHGGRSFYFSVAIICICVLLLEIGLTSHYALLVISVAILGLGELAT